MSIPTRFTLYDKDGNVIITNYGFFTMSYTDNTSSINLNLEYIRSGVSYLKNKFPNLKYLVSFRITDYMFDIDNLDYAIPNKFKTKSLT